MINPLIAEQLRRNAQTRDAWERFAGHRAHVMELLLSLPGDRLCVLGAGNCNDLDLPRLAERFAHVQLVDLDEPALRAAVDRQGMSSRVEVRGGVDLTGLLTTLAEPAETRSSSRERLEVWRRLAASAPAPALPAPCDAVVSLCLLSQLIDSLATGLGPRHPALLPLILAVRARHLRLLAELLAPGGEGVLVSDVVSSLTAPELPGLAEPALSAALERCVATRNYFTGLRPQAILDELRREPLAQLVESPTMLAPWLWDLGPRVYLVAAFRFRARGA